MHNICGGSAQAIQNSLGCSIEEAQNIADAYNNGFKGIAEFKSRGSKFVRENGYVLICALTGHKIYWYDHQEWLERQKSFTSEFWDKYRELKKVNPQHPTVKMVSYHFKAASKWDRMALNSCTQGSGIAILKYAMYLFFKWILENNLFGKVLIVNLVHDEACIEFPETISEAANKLQECMEKSAAVFCKKLSIPALPEVGTHWIH